MSFSATTPTELAELAIKYVGKSVNYTDIPTEGAQKAAQFISAMLQCI